MPTSDPDRCPQRPQEQLSNSGVSFWSCAYRKYYLPVQAMSFLCFVLLLASSPQVPPWSHEHTSGSGSYPCPWLNMLRSFDEISKCLTFSGILGMCSYDARTAGITRTAWPIIAISLVLAMPLLISFSSFAIWKISWNAEYMSFHAVSHRYPFPL